MITHSVGNRKLGRRVILTAAIVAVVVMIVSLEHVLVPSNTTRFYFLSAGASLVVLAPLLSRERGAVRFSSLVVLGLVLAALWALPWNPRRHFLQDLQKVRPGMTFLEVKEIMAAYQIPRSAVIENEREIPRFLEYRHSDSGWFDSDLAVIHLTDGRVSSVEFLSD